MKRVLLFLAVLSLLSTGSTEAFNPLRHPIKLTKMIIRTPGSFVKSTIDGLINFPYDFDSRVHGARDGKGDW